MLKPNRVFNLEYFFEAATDILCIAGFDGYFKKVNPVMVNTLGYTEEELLAAPIITFIHPQDRVVTEQRSAGLKDGNSFMNFENRYLAKDGAVIWLAWASVPVKRDNVVFAIAKNITYRKQLEEYDRISSILGMINEHHQRKFKKHYRAVDYGPLKPASQANHVQPNEGPSQADQFWLNSFETVVRKKANRADLDLKMISDELAISQRQLFRRVNQILGVTPNNLVRVIRLQLAWEAIASGKYRTIKEISNIAGYQSRSYFSKLFKEVYGLNVMELL